MGSCVAKHFRARACGALSLACAGRCLLCGQRTDTGDTAPLSIRERNGHSPTSRRETGNLMSGLFVGIHDLVREMPMGLAHAAICLALCAGSAFAQTRPNGEAPISPQHWPCDLPRQRASPPQGAPVRLTRSQGQGRPCGSPQGKHLRAQAAPEGSSRPLSSRSSVKAAEQAEHLPSTARWRWKSGPRNAIRSR
jgi:hypothetical protein